jgi:hypothetical protein
MEKIIFENDKVRVARRSGNSNCIVWYDLTDKYNDFKGFTQNKRGVDKAEAVINQLNQSVEMGKLATMGSITDTLDSLGMKPHTFCGMD